MKRVYLLASLLALGALALPGAASAANEYSFNCNFTGDVHLSPGLSIVSSEGPIEGTGTGTCSGTLKGDAFTSPLVSSGKGHYFGTCASGGGETHNKFILTDVNGKKVVFNTHGTYTSTGVVTNYVGKGEGNGTVTMQAFNFLTPPPAVQNCQPQTPIVHTGQIGTVQANDAS
jgi:hypothetical protein